jgi:hypothetical protein
MNLSRRNLLQRWIFALGFWVVSGGAAFASYQYTVIQYPGAFSTEVTGINNAGDIVGDYQPTSDGLIYGFKYSNGNYTTLPDSLSGTSVYPAYRINDSGQILYASAGDVGGGMRQSKILLTDGSFVMLPNGGPAPFAVTLYHDFNNAGGLVGGWNAGYCCEHGLIGMFINYDVPQNAVTNYGTKILAVNNTGEFAGFFYTSTFAQWGFVYDGGTVTDFQLPGQGSGIAPFGINDQGTVAGTYNDNTGRTRGFIVDGGNPVPFDLPPEMLWYNNPMTRVLDINDSGVLVGQFDSPDGVTEGFIAVPVETTPEPGTLAIIAFGMVSLGVIRGRRHARR